MENTIVKTSKKREVRSVRSERTRNTITEEDIRRRAYEIYKENGVASHNELDDWFRAERELRSYNHRK